MTCPYCAFFFLHLYINQTTIPLILGKNFFRYSLILSLTQFGCYSCFWLCSRFPALNDHLLTFWKCWCVPTFLCLFFAAYEEAIKLTFLPQVRLVSSSSDATAWAMSFVIILRLLKCQICMGQCCWLASFANVLCLWLKTSSKLIFSVSREPFQKGDSAEPRVRPWILKCRVSDSKQLIWVSLATASQACVPLAAMHRPDTTIHYGNKRTPQQQKNTDEQ